MKPHEEAWGPYMGVTTCGVKMADGTTIAVRIPDYPAARLMAAAPAMARALLAELVSAESGHTEECCRLPHGVCSARCAGIRAALKEAGVLE